MSAKKRTKANKPHVKKTDADMDVLKLFQQNRKTIIYSTCSVLIVVIFCIFYNIYTASSENTSSAFLSSFRANHSNVQSVTLTDIRELFDKTEGTAAEPWAKYYCLYIYFNKNDLENALKMLSDLESNFDDHYISKNDAFLRNVREILSKEKLWLNSTGK